MWIFHIEHGSLKKVVDAGFDEVSLPLPRVGIDHIQFLKEIAGRWSGVGRRFGNWRSIPPELMEVKHRMGPIMHCQIPELMTARDAVHRSQIAFTWSLIDVDPALSSNLGGGKEQKK